MINILAFGNSLTEGFGIKAQYSFPAQLEARLRDMGFDCRIINGGVSGDTTYGGLKRIDWYLKELPQVVLLELGINDGFLEYPISEIKENLDNMINKIKTIGAKIVLIGSSIPPGFMDIELDYCKKFENIYHELSKEHNIVLCPDILGTIIGNPKYTLMDMVHPNKRGVFLMVDKVIDDVANILKQIKKGD